MPPQTPPPETPPQSPKKHDVTPPQKGRKHDVTDSSDDEQPPEKVQRVER